MRSMAYILRDYVSSELAMAAETIVNTRETRGFPLPSECLKACAHARNLIRMRSSLATVAALPAPKDREIEPGMYRERRRDEEYREKIRRKKEMQGRW